MLYAIGWCESLYNNTAIKELLDTHYKNEPTMEFTVGVFNTQEKKQQYETFNKTHPNFKDCILASASVPVVFPSVLIDGQKYADGGIGHIIPIPEIKKFVEEHKGTNIVIDVLCCYPIYNAQAFRNMTVVKTSYAIINKLSETISETQWRELEIDLQTLDSLRSNTTKIRIFHPEQGEFSTFMSVDKSLYDKMFEEGKDAVKGKKTATFQTGAAAGLRKLNF